MRQSGDVLDAERVAGDAIPRAPGRAAARRELLWEIASGGSGLALTIYIWLHVFDVASLLFGPKGFDSLAVFLEERYIAQPIVVLITLLFLGHAIAAARKIPARIRERRRLNALARELAQSERRWQGGDGRQRPHEDSRLWVWQIRTGMLILLLGSFHIGMMTLDTFSDVWGERHGMEAATTMARVAGGLFWFYLVFLLLLGFHASAGCYRLAVKWGVGAGRERTVLKRVVRISAIVFVAAGTFVLGVAAGWFPAPFAFLTGG